METLAIYFNFLDPVWIVLVAGKINVDVKVGDTKKRKFNSPQNVDSKRINQDTLVENNCAVQISSIHKKTLKIRNEASYALQPEANLTLNKSSAVS